MLRDAFPAGTSWVFRPQKLQICAQMFRHVTTNFHDIGGVLKWNIWTLFNFIENGSTASGPRFSLARVCEASSSPCWQVCSCPLCHRKEYCTLSSAFVGLVHCEIHLNAWPFLSCLHRMAVRKSLTPPVRHHLNFVAWSHVQWNSVLTVLQ